MTTEPAPQLAPHGDSGLLRWRIVWRILLLWAVAWGLLTWGFEAALLLMVPDAPPEPWGGVYRLVETVLWIIPLATTIALAERWPITNPRRHWRRIAAQVALGLVLGPAWGVAAYALSPYLMPWWRPRGMWGIIAKEAKGMLFGYGTTAVLAHVTLRVMAQRRRALAAAEAEQRAAEARLDLLRLELQPESVLRSMEAVADMIPRDVHAANAALVLLTDSLDAAMDAAHARDLPLRAELANVEAQARLHRASGYNAVTFEAELDEHAGRAVVPQGLVQALVDDVFAITAEQRVGVHVNTSASRLGPTLLLAITATPARRGTALPLVQQLATRRALAHTRERLRMLFGDASEPGWTVSPGGDSATLILSLPWHEVLPSELAAAHAT